MTYKMVVADDSPSIQEAVRLAFPESEFEIYFFDDGLEVIKSFNQINPDLLLLNLTLPQKDGYEIASALPSQWKQTGLILLQGAFEPIDQQKIAELEYDDLVQEPFDAESLVKRAKEVLERKKSPSSLPEELSQVETAFSGLNSPLEKRVEELVQQQVEAMEKRVQTKVESGVKKWIQQEVQRRIHRVKKTQEEEV